MPTVKQPDSDYMRLKSIPKELNILALRNTLAYPFSILPSWVGITRSQKLVADVLQGNHFVGLIAMKDPSIEEPMPDQIYQIGTAGKIHRVFKTPDGQLHVIVEGMERFRIS